MKRTDKKHLLDKSEEIRIDAMLRQHLKADLSQAPTDSDWFVRKVSNRLPAHRRRLFSPYEILAYAISGAILLGMWIGMAASLLNPSAMLSIGELITVAALLLTTLGYIISFALPLLRRS